MIDLVYVDFKYRIILRKTINKTWTDYTTNFNEQ